MSAPDIWIWGRHPVLDAIRAGRTREVLIAAGDRSGSIIKEVFTESQERRIPIREVPLARLEQLSDGAKTQGVVARIEGPQVLDMDELLEQVHVRAGPVLLVALDQVQDPQNVGSLLRSAETAGAQGLIAHEHRSAGVTGAVVKASAGAALRVPIAEVPNLARGLKTIRDTGIWTVGLEAKAKMAIYEIDLNIPVCLVLGSEGTGLRRLTRESCDFLASLPMAGSVGSLNVAVAGAIAMYEVVRQRQMAVR